MTAPPELLSPIAFSVVIPTRGSRSSLKNAVQSVLRQTYPNFELLIIADGDSTEALKTLEGLIDPRVTVIAQEQLGVAAARNLGVAHAAHDWVTFLDDDDEARSHWLSNWAFAITTDTLAVTAGVCYIEGNGRTSDRWCQLSTTDPTMSASSILAGGFAIHRDTFAALGGYDETLAASENQDLGLRLCDQIVNDTLTGRIVSTSEIVVDIMVEAPGSREKRYGSSRGDAARVFLKRFRHRLDGEPATEASLYRIIARSERMRGDYPAAREAARRALRLQPTSVTNLRGVVLAHAPSSERYGREALRILRSWRR